MNPLQSIRVRTAETRGRLRVLEIDKGLFVQCDRTERECLIPGQVYTIPARLRNDGRCWVAASPLKGAAQ